MTRCFLFALLFLTHAATAQTTKYTGNWSGSVMGIPLIFHLTSNGTGHLKGTMDSPKQGVTGLAINQITFTGDSIICLIDASSIRYAATLSSDSTLAGNWQQGGSTFPLLLHRLTGTEASSAPTIAHPQTPVPPFPYHSDSVAYDNADRTVHLAATLTFPDKGGPFPAAILITGSGIQDRDETIFGHKPFAVIADYLTRRGYAVLRVDDRTAGLSTGETSTATSADFAGDVETSLAWLRMQKEIDPKKIGLIGHSEGAAIAPMIAARRKDIAFIISLAGPVSGYATMMYQILKPLQQSHMGDPLIAYYLTRQKIMLENMKQASDSASFMNGIDSEYRSYYAAIPDSIRPQYAFVASPQAFEAPLAPMANTLIGPWWKFFLDYDATTYYRKVKCPVLLLGGEKDIQVPNEIDMPVIASLLKDQKNKQVETHLLPGLNHLFQHCHTCTVQEYGQLEETFSPEALAIMGDWLDKVIR